MTARPRGVVARRSSVERVARDNHGSRRRHDDVVHARETDGAEKRRERRRDSRNRDATTVTTRRHDDVRRALSLTLRLFRFSSVLTTREETPNVRAREWVTQYCGVSALISTRERPCGCIHSDVGCHFAPHEMFDVSSVFSPSRVSIVTQFSCPTIVSSKGNPRRCLLACCGIGGTSHARRFSLRDRRASRSVGKLRLVGR